MIDVERVDFIRVPVKDIDELEEFYARRSACEQSPNSSARWVEYETGNVTLA